MDDSDLPPLNRYTFFKETTLALWYGLAKVLLGGFLFTLVSLPALFLILEGGGAILGILLAAITIGPAWLALCAVVAAMILREIYYSPFDFFRSFGHFYLRGVVLGGIMAFPLAAAAGTIPLLALTPVPTFAWIGIGADLAVFFFLSSLYLYVCPQIVIYDVGVRLALRNGLVLETHYLANAIGLLAAAIVLVFVAYKISLFLLIAFPACWLVFVINNFRLVLRIESNRTGA